jgi:hypothetical protein
MARRTRERAGSGPETTADPAARDERGLSEDVGVAFGCHDGILRFVSALLGRVLWSIDLGGVIFDSPTVVAMGSEGISGLCRYHLRGVVCAGIASRL